MPDNMRPHRPTFITVLVVVAIGFAVYHFTFGRKRR